MGCAIIAEERCAEGPSSSVYDRSDERPAGGPASGPGCPPWRGGSIAPSITIQDGTARVEPGTEGPDREETSSRGCKHRGSTIGGELNAVVKDHRSVRGKFCLAFPDTYAIGMSNHGLQVLYHGLNRRGRLGVRAGVRAVGRHGTGPAAERTAAGEPGNVYAFVGVRRAGFHATARSGLHQRADDPRFGRDSVGGTRSGARASAGDRRGALRAEPGADGGLRRSIRDRRRGGDVAGGVRRVAGGAVGRGRPGGGTRRVGARASARVRAAGVPRGIR